MTKNLTCRPSAIIKEFPHSVANRMARKTSLDLALPWMPFTTIEFLRRKARPHWRVMEFGIGGSTLFLADLVGEIVSIEHDAAWVDIVRDHLDQQGHHHVNLQHLPPDNGNDSDYRSHVREHSQHSFRTYATAIDSYPDGYFDMVVVDGRVREACTRHALPKVRRGGYLLLDNSERLRYRPIHNLMAGQPQRTFTGFTPYHIDPSQSTVWLKRH